MNDTNAGGVAGVLEVLRQMQANSSHYRNGLPVLADHHDGEFERELAAIRAVEAMAGALCDCREALRRAGAVGELAVVDAALAAFGSAAPAGDGDRVSGRHIENLVEFARNAPRTDRELPEPPPSDFPSAPAGDGVKVKWAYCPECGSNEVRHAEGDHKQCVCGQEWFADLDYTDVVRKNLAKPAAPAGGGDARFADDIALIEAILKGYPDSIAKADGLATCRRLASTQAAGGGGELPTPAMVFNTLDHSCAFSAGVLIAGESADFYTAEQMREYGQQCRLASTGSAPAPSADARVCGYAPGLAQVHLQLPSGPLPDWLELGYPVVVSAAPTQEQQP